MLEDGKGSEFGYDNAGMAHDDNLKNEATLPGNRDSAPSDLPENNDMVYAY